MNKILEHKLFLGGVLIVMLFQSCGINPVAWSPPEPLELKPTVEIDSTLWAAKKIDLMGWYGPEDIVFDQKGNLYCGVHVGKQDFRDGKILKISSDGNISIFYDAGSWVAGLHFDQNNNLIALSHRLGLIRISTDKKITVLANQDEYGRPFLIPNGLDIASDGTIYFSNTSHLARYSIKYGRKLILEQKPDGGLFQYNPLTKRVTTLIDGTYFGNGVVLSKKEDFLLMTETSRYRILKYWLKGTKKGTTEVFMDDLPGFPNGISIREDGSFWLGFSTKRNPTLDNIHPKKGMKKIVYGLPEILQPKQEAFGIILNISEQGKVISTLLDTSGKVIPEAGSVQEKEGILYIGGDIIPYIAVYILEQKK